MSINRSFPLFLPNSELIRGRTYTVSCTPYTKTSPHGVRTTYHIDTPKIRSYISTMVTDCNSSATPRVEMGSHLVHTAVPRSNFEPPSAAAPRRWSRLQSWQRRGRQKGFCCGVRGLFPFKYWCLHAEKGTGSEHFYLKLTPILLSCTCANDVATKQE